jgi:hypothetical protein
VNLDPAARIRRRAEAWSQASPLERVHLARQQAEDAERLLPGVLRAAPALRTRVLAMADEAGLAPAEMNALVGLWGTLRVGVGEALFPVALHDTAAVVCLLRVGWAGAPAAPVQAEDDFRAAVDRALDWVVEELRDGDPAFRAALTWTVEPRIPVRGGSVGFAAIVAAASFLLRTPPSAREAWTGCLHERSTLDAERVADTTLGAKIAAVDSAGLLVLHVPAGQDTVAPGALKLQGHAKAKAVLDAAFDRRRGPPRAAPTLDVSKLPVASLRVLAILEAAGRPLDRVTLAQALSHGEHWPEPLDGPAHLGVAVDRVQDRIQQEDGRLRLRPAKATPTDPTWIRAAHRALFAVSTAPADRFVSAVNGGLSPDGALRDVLASAGRAELEQLAGALGEEELSRHLLNVGFGGRAGILRLAWAGVRMPWPLAPIAEPLFAAESEADLLLGIQALLECALHLVATVALALGCAAPGKRLAERPSFGQLAGLAKKISQVPEVDHPLRRALADALAASPDDVDAVTRDVNALIHDRQAFARLADGLTDGVARLLPAAVRLAEALSRGLRDAQVRRIRGSTDLEVVAPEGPPIPLGRELRVAADEPGPAYFYRGRLADKVRYWSFEGAEPLWTEGAPFPADAPIATPLPRVDALPAPLACVEARVRSKLRAPIARVARLDEHLAGVLRLALFSTLAALPDGITAPVSAGERNWLSLGNARNLYDELVARCGAHSPGAFLLDGEAREAVLRLIDGLEQIGHAPAPLSASEPLLTVLESWLPVLHAGAPWVGGARLVGFERGKAWSLSGVGTTEAAPVALPRIPTEGEIWLAGPDGAWSFGPFAELHDGKAWWLRRVAKAVARKPIAGLACEWMAPRPDRWTPDERPGT